MIPLEQNNTEVNYYPTQISGEGCSVSTGNIAQHTRKNENKYLES